MSSQLSNADALLQAREELKRLEALEKVVKKLRSDIDVLSRYEDLFGDEYPTGIPQHIKEKNIHRLQAAQVELADKLQELGKDSDERILFLRAEIERLVSQEHKTQREKELAKIQEMKNLSR